MNRSISLTLLAALLLPGLLSAQDAVPEEARKAAEVINEASLRGPVGFLADDLLEGRGPASRGDRLTQLYLASTLQYLGFAPAFGADGYLQTFAVVGVEATPPKTWSFQKDGQSVTLAARDQFMAASGVQEDRSVLKDAELVFVGYGIEAPEYGWNDFKGMDLKGKVLVMLNNDPDWDPALFEGVRRQYYGRWSYKYESAARQGAAGAILIHTTPSAGYPWQVVQTSWTGPQFELPAAGEPRIQVASWVTEDAARQIAKLAGRDLDALVQSARSRDFRPIPLGVTTSLALSNRVDKTQTANVGGLLRGSDPKLAEEVVIYTAHHDHLGIGTPDATGDTIYNGALDNGAGVTQVLAIARAYAALPAAPRRSVLILFVAAEEQGLLGSEYYAKHPSLPPGRIAANINYDGGNIFGRSLEVASIGLGKSSLDGIVKTLAAEQGRTVVGDQFPDRGSFYRSDQFNFAKIGVPAIYMGAGVKFRDHADDWGKERVEAYVQKNYHQPSDEITAEWTFDGMIEDARLGFFAGLLVANADQMPTWTPGDEFEAARKAALAAVGK
ncbi:MAG TPA: peptidase M28 [Acidobacteria bacterium]|nr:peptidase M28 [Acidobacteriota bacterium]